MYTIQLKRILKRLLYLAIFFFPFNGLPYFKSIFREIAFEGAFYPTSLILLILFIKPNLIKFNFKDRTNFLITIFFIFVLFSVYVNLFDITSNFHKGRTGIEKLIFQRRLSS